MKYSRIAFHLLFLLILFKSKEGRAQDTLIFSSGQPQLAKVIEITPTQIRYKNYSNLTGPDYLVDSKIVKEIRYANGIKEKIRAQEFKETVSADTIVFMNGKKLAVEVLDMSFDKVSFHTKGSHIIYRKSNRTINEIITASGKHYRFYAGHWIEKSKWIISENEFKKQAFHYSDFIHVNLSAGLVMNKAHCNIPRVTTDKYTSGYEPSEYESVDESRDQPCFMHYAAGVNLHFYASPYIQPTLSISFLESEGKFKYYAYDPKSNSPFSTKRIEGDVYSIARYLNVYAGVRAVAWKHLNFEMATGFNLPLATTNRIHATETTTYWAFNGQYYYTDRIEKQDVKFKNHDTYVKLAFSFSPKLSYTFNWDKHKVGIYASRNFALFDSAYLPWWSAGLIYFPFKNRE